MNLRFYSNETDDVNPIAEILDIDDTFGERIDSIIMKYRDTSVPIQEDAPVLVNSLGVSEIRIVCNNVFIANTPKDHFLTNQFFKQTFYFDYNKDLDYWLPQIAKVAEELDKLPRGNGLYWYMKS